MAQQQQSNPAAVGCGAIMVIVFFFSCLGGIFRDSESSPPAGGGSAAPRASDDKIEAWVMAKEFVTKQLKAPSTADFGSVFGDYQKPDDCVTSLGGGRYSVRGWVDAQNSFGAKLRTRWSCTVRNAGNDRWVCESVLVN